MAAVDVLLVGFGWTGAIMAERLTAAGLNVLALERGGWRDTPENFATTAALRADLGKTRHGTKIVMQWTGASERAVKNWFAGTKGPSGEHLATLVRHSDSVMNSFLRLSGRERGPSDRKLMEAHAKLSEVLELIGQMADSGQ